MSQPESAEPNYSLNEATSEQTWESAQRFYLDLTALPRWKNKRPLLRLISHLTETDVKLHFRAGQSLWLFFITAKATHGISKDDPVIKIDCSGSKFLVEYWMGWHANGPCLQSVRCREHGVMTTLIPMLRRLWADTHESPYGGTALSGPIREYARPPIIPDWSAIQSLFRAGRK